jgi:hypothetical protein
VVRNDEVRIRIGLSAERDPHKANRQQQHLCDHHPQPAAEAAASFRAPICPPERAACDEERSSEQREWQRRDKLDDPENQEIQKMQQLLDEE